jgi:hypothetical protein
VSKGPTENLDQGARHKVVYIVIQPSSVWDGITIHCMEAVVRKLVGTWRCPCLPRSTDLDRPADRELLRSGLPSEVDSHPRLVGTWHRRMWGYETDRKKGVIPIWEQGISILDRSNLETVGIGLPRGKRIIPIASVMSRLRVCQRFIAETGHMW